MACLKTAGNIGFRHPCIKFSYRHEGNGDVACVTEHDRWAKFYAVVYDISLVPEAMNFWRETGDGISSRHAAFVLELFPILLSESQDPTLRTVAERAAAKVDVSIFQALPTHSTTTAEIGILKTLLAQSAASTKPQQRPVQANDIFLYPKGLSGIFAVARALRNGVPPGEKATAIIYG